MVDVVTFMLLASKVMPFYTIKTTFQLDIVELPSDVVATPHVWISRSVS